MKCLTGTPGKECRQIALLVLSCAISLCVSIASWAGVGGSISGSVSDSSGAVVPKAVVTLTNSNTGISKVVTADDKGAYAFPSLPIGHYNIEFAAPGFKPYRRTDVLVE